MEEMYLTRFDNRLINSLLILHFTTTATGQFLDAERVGLTRTQGL